MKLRKPDSALIKAKQMQSIQKSRNPYFPEWKSNYRNKAFQHNRRKHE